MKVRWTFEREAVWMMWLFLVPAIVGILLAYVIPWLREMAAD